MRDKNNTKKYNDKYYKEKRQKILDQKRRYYLKHREELNKISSKHYHDNKVAMLRSMREYYETPENRRKKIFFKARERARIEGMEFTITPEDIVIPALCPVFKIELTHKLGKGQLQTNSSLDRIDNTKGYTPGNVQVMSRKANTMKNNATPEELLKFADWVYKTYKSHEEGR